MSDLVIQETHIRRDDCGRYCLNDLHRAAGGLARHRPALFFRRKDIGQLVKEIARGNCTNSHSCHPVHAAEGQHGGTYVARELVYAYAMWISPAFALRVIRTYDALMQAQIDKLNELGARRARAELEYLEAQAEASRCGLGLRRWRDCGPALEARIKALREESQPSLFIH